MNHFVIANWYDPESPAILANANVKIMKYYSGAEISGTVMTEDDGLGLPNARILIERDAFSGEVQKISMRIHIGFQSVSLTLTRTVIGVS